MIDDDDTCKIYGDFMVSCSRSSSPSVGKKQMSPGHLHQNWRVQLYLVLDLLGARGKSLLSLANQLDQRKSEKRQWRTIKITLHGIRTILDVSITIRKNDFPYLRLSVRLQYMWSNKWYKKAYSPDNCQRTTADQLQQQLVNYPRKCNMNRERIKRSPVIQINTSS